MLMLAQVVKSVSAPLILGGTIFGIVAKYVYDYIVRYLKDKERTRFDWKGFGLTFVMSLFLSIILYGTVLDRVKDLQDGFLVLSIAFQNGFFWQAVFGEIGKKYAE